MSKVLMYREGTVYSAAKYIANVNNVDDHIKTLCEMIQLIYTTIPEGKKQAKRDLPASFSFELFRVFSRI
jgi:hypothetical protein